MLKPRHVVYADLTPYGAPPMPVAAFYTRFAATGFAWFASLVTGLKCGVTL